MHGFQLWANLPARDKMMELRYRGVTSAEQDMPVLPCEEDARRRLSPRGPRPPASPLSSLGRDAINLATLEAQRVDNSSSPGPRGSSAILFQPERSTLWLFGGRGPSGIHGDLWRYDLDDNSWSVVSGSPAPNGPLPMEGAALAACPFDGSVSVLAGKAAGGAAEPAWRFRGAEWRTHHQIMGFSQ
jgi:hypothetical protein